MNKTKALLAAATVASASFFSQAAFAADISNPATDLTLEDNAAFFGALFPGNNNGNTFTDRYNFSTSVAGTLTADVLAFSRSNSGINLTGFNLFDGSGQLVAGTQLLNGANDLFAISSFNLNAGSYWLEVSGNAVGQGAGKYYASLALAPVPEPETYAMMLGGLGLLAVAARRRKAKQAA